MVKKLAKPERVTNRCKVHKFRRFSKANKTYRTDIYYCVDCPSYVRIENIIGHKSVCWRCGISFTISVGNLALKPECGCRRLKLADREIPDSSSLQWLDASDSEESNQSRDSVVEDLLSIISSK